MPAARQAALASLHDRASFISVYSGGGGGEGEWGGGEGEGGGGMFRNKSNYIGTN